MALPTSITWSRDEEKAFENGIAMHWVDGDPSEKHWGKIASMVPSKSLEELKQHYQELVEDVGAIEAGTIQLPIYLGEEPTSSSTEDSHANSSDKRLNCGFGNGSFLGLAHDTFRHGGKGGARLDQERRKGIPWTEEEHRYLQTNIPFLFLATGVQEVLSLLKHGWLFLLGLEKFGKGDWRSISRNFVISRTPTQVASHAQKYFIRLNSMNRDRRRSSIHDITSVNNGDVSSHQPPITGQQANTNPTGTGGIGSAVKHRAQPHMPGLGMYGAPVGHPVAVAAPPGHMASAVGTPVMLPPPGHHHPHPPYVVPVAYPVAPPQTQTLHQ